MPLILQGVYDGYGTVAHRDTTALCSAAMAADADRCQAEEHGSGWPALQRPSLSGLSQLFPALRQLFIRTAVDMMAGALCHIYR